MKIDFYLRFYTQPGQSMWLSGNWTVLGEDDPEKSFPLQYVNNEFWHGSIALEDFPADPLIYRYILKGQDKTLTEEGGTDRGLDAPGNAIAEIQVIDTWNYAGEYENVFYTSPFRETLLPHHKPTRKGRPRTEGKRRTEGQRRTDYTHVFQVKAPLLAEEEMVCLLGSGSALHDWNQQDPIHLSPDGNWWTAYLSVPPENFPIEYKYGIWNKRTGTFLRWEAGPNRTLPGDARPNKISILHDGFIHDPNTSWHGAGVAIPVFSLRSKDSLGVGEFTDLRLLIDWAVKCGLRLVQILPVQDTTATYTWLDSYPYAAISAFALHPIYLNLGKCAGKKYASLIKPLRKKQKELNSEPDLDYEQVLRIKLLTVKELYELQKEEFQEDPDFLEFFDRNSTWLVPYAAFCYLRDKHHTPDFTTWTVHRHYQADIIREYTAPGTTHYDAILLQYFIQYHLHLQLRDAVDYAHEHGVVMKGDIPIGIYRYSCDAWMEPRLYHMDQQAGAPPDNFAVKGQNWGFPTYNWDEMRKDGYGWWKRRFEHMRNYFDAFRIDHILGFFRIWSIPMDVVEGILGHFDPAIPVRRSEFQDRNIWFEPDRYTKPFINDAVLWEIFGNDSEIVKSNYLEPRPNGMYSLRKEYSTQRCIDTCFSKREKSDFSDRIRSGLFDLVSNVILLEIEGSGHQQFHFRIDMEHTSSFRYLEWHTQQQLKDLYVNYFYFRQDDFWEREAMRKLPPLKRATNMLVFGEDLGMVPRCVPNVMRHLGILSMEIQRMPKNPAREFFHPAEAPYLSVVTPSTHDMSTIRGWWEEDRAKTQRFYNFELGQWGEAPQFCEPWINRAIILQHLNSPAQWCVFQLQDIMGMSETFRRENPNDERINIPANPHHYWRYRMHLTLEELLEEKSFNSGFRESIKASTR